MTIFWDGSGNQLVAEMSGVSGVEQMHFVKTLLFPAVYQHQKVRALEATIQSIAEAIWREPELIPDSMSHLRLQSIGDFLRTTEYEFFGLRQLGGFVGERVRRLLERKVLRRSLHISQHSIDTSATSESGYKDLVALGDANKNPVSRSKLAALSKQIYDRLEASRQTNDLSLRVDIPPQPRVSKDITNCHVLTLNGTTTPLTNVFPIGKWLDTYGGNKWAAHVYYEPEPDHQRAASRAAASILKEQFELVFRDVAFLEAKVVPPAN